MSTHEEMAHEGDPVRAVLFDFGGTLCDFAGVPGRARLVALEALGLDPSSDEVAAAGKAAAAEVSRTYATQTAYLHRDLFRDQLVRTAELLGVDATPVLADFARENTAHLGQAFRPRPDAADTLRRLRRLGVHCSVVSNADDDFLVPSLAATGLDVLLDGWTTSEEAASCKPDPGIFEVGLTKAGATAAEALFVGDSLQHDVAGAARVGMRTVLIDNGLAAAPFSEGLEADATPDHEVSTLAEVGALVARVNRGR